MAPELWTVHLALAFGLGLMCGLILDDVLRHLVDWVNLRRRHDRP